MTILVENQSLHLTATATPKVRVDIQKNLKVIDAKLFLDSFNRKNLFYDIRPKHDVEKEMIKFIKQHPGKSGIVYCLSRKKVEEIAETLQVNGIKRSSISRRIGIKKESYSSGRIFNGRL